MQNKGSLFQESTVYTENPSLNNYLRMLLCSPYLTAPLPDTNSSLAYKKKKKKAFSCLTFQTHVDIVVKVMSCLQQYRFPYYNSFPFILMTPLNKISLYPNLDFFFKLWGNLGINIFTTSSFPVHEQGIVL